MTVTTVSGRSASRDGMTMNRLTITATRKPTNDQRSTVSETRGSSHVPICAPTTAPAARISAGIHATEPWTAYEMTPTVAVGTIAASDVPGGEALVEAEDQHQQRHDHRAAADAEQPGQQAGQQADPDARQDEPSVARARSAGSRHWSVE